MQSDPPFGLYLFGAESSRLFIETCLCVLGAFLQALFDAPGFCLGEVNGENDLNAFCSLLKPYQTSRF